MAASTHKAVAKLVDGLRVEAKARDFKLVIDEPIKSGGTDQGMTPLELVLSSLGACQTIVASAYAEIKGVDLQDMWVEVEGDHDREINPGFSEVRFTVHIKSNSTEKKIKEFIKFIEETCPIADVMNNGAKRLVNAGLVIEK